MSDHDSFIDEVTEEVRRDKLFALMRRHGWIGIVAILAIVGGAAWTEWQRAQTEARAQAFGTAVLAALADDDPAARLAALGAVEAEGGQAATVRFLAAGEALAAKNEPEAIRLLGEVYGDDTLPQSYRHLAALKWLSVYGDRMVPAQRDTMIAELTAPGAPYRLLGLEQQALVHMAEGRADEAIAILKGIVEDAGVTASLRRRASEVIVALGGTAGTE